MAGLLAVIYKYEFLQISRLTLRFVVIINLYKCYSSAVVIALVTKFAKY